MRLFLASWTLRFLWILLTAVGLPAIASADARTPVSRLSAQDRAWISAHPIVRLGIDPAYGPYSFVDEQGQLKGIVPEMLSHIEKTLGIRFEVTSDLKWPELMVAARERRIDAIATMVKLPSRERDFVFSEIYLPTPLVVLTRVDAPQMRSIDALRDLRVALVEGYSSSEQTMEMVPDLAPYFVPTPNEGLSAVSRGTAEAYVGVIGVSSFSAARQGLTNLKVNAMFEPAGNGQRFGIRKDWPQLASLINHALANMPPDERTAIFARWLPIQADEITRLVPPSLVSRLFPWLLLFSTIVGLAYLSAVWWNRRLRNELSRRKAELERALSIASIGDWLFDVETQKITWSDELFRIAGRPPQTLDWPTLRSWIHPAYREMHDAHLAKLAASSPGEQLPPIVSRLLRPDGQSRWLEITSATDFDEKGKAVRHYGAAIDITQRMLAEEQIRHLAYFDALTGLPNRRLLVDRLEQAISNSGRSREYGALLMLDLDRFKDLNDTQGHGAGDQLLIEVAQRLKTQLRDGDTVSRLGGDEYVIIAEKLGTDISSAAIQADVIAEKCRAALEQPFKAGSEEAGHNCTTSIGITLFLGSETDLNSVLKQADVALYQAKNAGRNAIRFFNSAMQSAIEARIKTEAALRRGIKANELHLHYQPQVDCSGNRIGAEALLRWIPENAAPVPPSAFIPIAEDSGLILTIGRWVLETACNQLKAWESDPATRHLTIAINVSARQFHQATFVAQVLSAIERTGANPLLLKLELTESVVLERVDEVIDRMLQLKRIGIGFSLDDFGTGYSSLSYLKKLPLDQVKIDQSFVHDLTNDPNDAAIVRAILAIGQSLSLNVIAEGVETEAQRARLIEYGCPQFQGYLFSKPIAIEHW